MVNNIKNKVSPYQHEGRWFKAFIEKDENGELKLTRCDLPGAELTDEGLKLPEGFHAVDYNFDTHYTAPAVLAGQEQAAGGGDIPIASASTLGGVKIGDGININSEGIISAQGEIDFNNDQIIETTYSGYSGSLTSNNYSYIYDSRYVLPDKPPSVLIVNFEKPSSETNWFSPVQIMRPSTFNANKPEYCSQLVKFSGATKYALITSYISSNKLSFSLKVINIT